MNPCISNDPLDLCYRGNQRHLFGNENKQNFNEYKAYSFDNLWEDISSSFRIVPHPCSESYSELCYKQTYTDEILSM